MKHNWRAKIVSTAVALCLAFSALPVFADEAKQITISFEDVTLTDAIPAKIFQFPAVHLQQTYPIIAKMDFQRNLLTANML